MVPVKLTQEIVRDLFIYRDGKLFCLKSRGAIAAGKEAGTFAHGYRRARALGNLIYVHRLIWLYHHGQWPVGEIDHINRDRSDNRIENLRDVAPSQNMRNMGLVPRNTTGAKGVYWHKRAKCFTAAYKGRNGKQVHVGCFPTVEYAAIARHHAVRAVYGEELYP